MGHIKSNQLKLAGLMDNDIYDIYFFFLLILQIIAKLGIVVEISRQEVS